MNRIKPIVDELAPKLNAYLKSIGKIPEKTTDNGQRSTDITHVLNCRHCS